MQTVAIPKLLTPKQAAEIIGVAEQTLAVWRSAGRHDLPFVKAGRLVRYRASDIESWLASRTATSTT
jgi:excisionase family DNA binding protein